MIRISERDALEKLLEATKKLLKPKEEEKESTSGTQTRK